MPAHTAARRSRFIIIAGLCVLAATPAVGDGATVRDAGGRAVTVADASRIVAVGGAVTEILYALGLEDRIVGVDTTSLYPPRARADKPSVGYMRQLSAEGVLGLAPSLVLAADGSGPKETISVLESARVAFVRVPDRFTGEGIVEKIRLIAQVTGAVERGECLAKATETGLGALATLRKRIERPLRVLFILSFANGRPMVSGRSTAADGIIKLAGAVNAITEYEGYKLINDESVIAAHPDAILAMHHDALRIDAQTVFEHPAFATTPAAVRGAFISMESLYLLGFGPRSARAARDLAVAFYPALGHEPAPSAGMTEKEVCRQ